MNKFDDNIELLTYSDVCIKPQWSDIKSRKDVDTSLEINGLKLDFPLISAPMDTVTGAEMASTIANFGGIGLLHRFCTIDESLSMYRTACSKTNRPDLIGASFGLNDRTRAELLYGAGCRIFCLDVAYGASQRALDELIWLKETYGNDLILITGSIGTKEVMIKQLYNFNYPGLLFRTGLSSGGTCSTAIKTGVITPPLSTVASIGGTLINSGRQEGCIADGGVKTPGDFCKALGAGAKLVMLGSMLGATDESPGDIIEENGNKFKIVRGMASREVNEQVLGGLSEWKTAEGVSVKVPYKGSVQEVLKDLNGGLRSSMTYVGANNLNEYFTNVEFVKLSPQSAALASPHILN
jgi:IMP dehydrogenase/GMP reductase